MKRLFAITLGVLLVAVPGIAVAGDANVAPMDMHGVKIKQPGGDHRKLGNTCKYQSGAGDRGYGSVVRNMQRDGVYHLFIKYPQAPKQVPAFCTEDRLEEEILGLLKAMASVNRSLDKGERPMRAWVWQERWFANDKDPDGDSRAHNHRVYEDYVTDMSNLINRAHAEGASSPFEGIGVIENNLPSSNKVRDYALRVARDINRRTSGWLKTHTLLFPGAGMGSWFKGIGGSEGMRFLKRMKTEVKYFSFIYKFMKSQDGGVCKRLERFYYGGATDWQKRLGHTEDSDSQRTYIEDTLGFGDLSALIEKARLQGLRSVANVVFWGDSGDGLLEMNGKNVSLMHNLLVDELDQPGYFFDFAIIGANEENKLERSKFVLLDDGKRVVRNTTNANGHRGEGDSMTVFDEWVVWRKKNAGY